MLRELDSSTLCACMGPQKGEPLCPCAMVRTGQRTKKDYEWSAEEKAGFIEALKQYGWKEGLFDKACERDGR